MGKGLGPGVLGVLAVVVAAGLARGDVETARTIEATAGERFDALRASYGELTYADLERRLRLREPSSRLSFDPTRVKYFELIRKSLALTPEEQRIYRQNGVVSVDHNQRYSMASTYLTIYRNDLPVLITVDSILHAWHRSFDAILVEIETTQIAPALEEVLAAAQARLKAEAAKLPGKPSDVSKDVDFYLTVARNLLADPLRKKQATQPRRPVKPDEPDCDNPASSSTAECQKASAERKARLPVVASLFGQDAEVRDILDKVLSFGLADTRIFGGRRTVDFAQFRPRGHYANSPALCRYFAAMTWLGRADLGFHLSPPAAGTGLKVDVGRERADAVVLSDLLRSAGQLDTLVSLDRLLGYLVGPSDNATPEQVAAAIQSDGAGGLAHLSDRTVAERVVDRVPAARQQILSQVMDGADRGSTLAQLPELFQLFGQRFAIDSFVLSRVVVDASSAPDMKDIRDMPSGLDVMAALGDDEAVRLLRPELEKFGYASSLMAARTLLHDRPAGAWSGTAYDAWLDTLAQLPRPTAGAVPQVMRSPSWRRKQLQTELASWAELRHDTVLYVKQSYGRSGIICEYPAGYVEPYPKTFERAAYLADELARRLAGLDRSNEGLRTFLSTFSSRVHRLQGLAEKELAGQPFTGQEKQFVKDAVHLKTVAGGCTGPSEVYSGWYPTLFYSGAPDHWEPTVADVHTSTEHGVLEVGVGDVDFLVVAVDNGRDRAAYVGPVYSYYEFPSASRLTDEEWRGRLSSGHAPPRPPWVGAFQGAAKERAVLPAPEDAVDPAAAKLPLALPGGEGALSLAAVDEGMNVIGLRLQACATSSRLDNSLTVDIEITPRGHVRSVGFSHDVPSEFQACLKDGIRHIEFEHSERGLKIAYPISRAYGR
jgi:hypothetical protein